MHRLEQVQRAADVGPVVALGMADGLAHQRQRGEVQHPVEALARAPRRPRRGRADPRPTRRAPGGTASRWPLLEVVEHDDLVLGAQQVLATIEPM